MMNGRTGLILSGLVGFYEGTTLNDGLRIDLLVQVDYKSIDRIVTVYEALCA